MTELVPESAASVPESAASVPRPGSACRTLDDFQYGGQAVIEGVMMRGRRKVLVAVRKADGSIAVSPRPLSDLARRYRFLAWPVLRGAYSLFESLVVGIQALMFSANQANPEEEAELSPWELTVTMGIAVGLFVLLFIVVPNLAAVLVQRVVKSVPLVNAVEGALRIGIFLLYIVCVSRIKDIQRVFQYHGAEHKVINAWEAGDGLSVDAARKHATLHPRCGTSFLLVVMVLMILIYSVLGRMNIWARIASRLLLLPVVAGISYEVIKLAGRRANRRWMAWVIAPGLWLQKLTTREPDDAQIEVAVKALQGALEGDGVVAHGVVTPTL